MGVKSVMDAEPTADEVKQFEEYDTEIRLSEEEIEREIAAAKGEQTQSQFDPLAGCDKRDQRVRDTERDGRLRHKNYDVLIDDYIIPAIHRKPELFKVLRDTVDAGEVAYQLARLIQNPQLAERPEFRGFQEYLQDVSERRTGKFDNLTPEAFAQLLDAYNAYADEGETIEEFFTRGR
jgi:hypothetical protein